MLSIGAMSQGTMPRSNQGKEVPARHRHMACMRNIITFLHRRFIQESRVMTMQDRNTRRSLRWAIVSAIVLSALFAGLPAAQASDQQATTAEMDNELNWRAASGTGFSGAYAQAPMHQGRVYARAHRSDR